MFLPLGEEGSRESLVGGRCAAGPGWTPGCGSDCRPVLPELTFWRDKQTGSSSTTTGTISGEEKKNNQSTMRQGGRSWGMRGTCVTESGQGGL